MLSKHPAAAMKLLVTSDRAIWPSSEKFYHVCPPQGIEDGDSRVLALPFHWDDRSKMRSDASASSEFTDRLLVALASKLNELHEVDRPPRYWRLILGLWLQYFVDIAFERDEALLTAIDAGCSELVVHQSDGDQPVAWDFVKFTEQFVSDSWNEQLYATLAESQPALEVSRAGARGADVAPTETLYPGRGRARQAILNGVRRIEALITRRKPTGVSRYRPREKGSGETSSGLWPSACAHICTTRGAGLALRFVPAGGPAHHDRSYREGSAHRAAHRGLHSADSCRGLR